MEIKDIYNVNKLAECRTDDGYVKIVFVVCSGQGKLGVRVDSNGFHLCSTDKTRAIGTENAYSTIIRNMAIKEGTIAEMNKNIYDVMNVDTFIRYITN